MFAEYSAYASTELFSTRQVLLWWEWRRILYNALLLIVGMSSIAGMEWLLSPLIPLGDNAVEPMLLILGIAVYGLMANVCYTLGWIVELSSRKRDATAARLRGRWMFRNGLLFSCVLTSLPLWFACSLRLAHLIVALIHRGT